MAGPKSGAPLCSAFRAELSSLRARMPTKNDGASGSNLGEEAGVESLGVVLPSEIEIGFLFQIRAGSAKLHRHPSLAGAQFSPSFQTTPLPTSERVSAAVALPT